MRNSVVGLVVLIAKLGPKLVPLFLKLGEVTFNLFKSAIGIKAAGLATSVGLYAYLFTWEMGVSLVVFLLVHEYGHMWAMKRCGLKTRGMYLIPGFGAVAIADDTWGSARNEAYIAIMGPIFGLVGFVVPTMLIYYETEQPLWAAISAFTCFINLINLLPIHPLDGGRILKAVSYSKWLGRSLLFTLAISFITALFGLWAGFSLIVIMAFVGFWELAYAFGIQERIIDFLKTILRVIASVFFVVGVLVLYTAIVFWDSDDSAERVSWLKLAIFTVITIVTALAARFDISINTVKAGRPLYYYPIVVLRDAWRGLRQIVNVRTHHLKPIKDYKMMGVTSKVYYGGAFAVLVVIHVMIILTLAQVPGSEFVGELLE